MRLHMFFGRSVFLAVALTGATVQSAAAPPARQSAVAYMSQPTLIGSTFVVSRAWIDSA